MAAPIDLHEVAERELEAQSRYPWRIKACNSTACLSAGAAPTAGAIEGGVAERGLGGDVQVTRTGCMGLCSRGPLVRVIRRGGDETLYGDVTPEVGVDIVESHVVGRRPLADHVLDPDMAFFASQERIVLANSGVIEPDRIESYVAVGGYTALETALTTMTPQQIVETVQRSGLRGRGGAGYPTGNKWALLAAAEADQKYVVANGDEGDPGAYMDRTVMEDDPHRLIEGIAIAAFATGASRAYIYVRAEYPRAVERLDRAIRVARRNRLLGRRILDTDFDLAQQQLGFYADITGRVGLVFDRFLIYAKGGVAFADIDLRAADFDGGGTVLDTNDLTTLSGIRTGYVVGGGIDIALNEIWSVNAEYRYMDFGTEYSTNLDTDDWYHKNDVHLVTIGVKAKLGDLFGPMGAN